MQNGLSDTKWVPVKLLMFVTPMAPKSEQISMTCACGQGVDRARYLTCAKSEHRDGPICFVTCNECSISFAVGPYVRFFANRNDVVQIHMKCQAELTTFSRATIAGLVKRYEPEYVVCKQVDCDARKYAVVELKDAQTIDVTLYEVEGYIGENDTLLKTEQKRISSSKRVNLEYITIDGSWYKASNLLEGIVCVETPDGSIAVTTRVVQAGSKFMWK